MNDEPKKPPERPMPLKLRIEDYERIEDYFVFHYGCRGPETDRRLLIEILDCLRRIDGKLGELLSRPKGGDP